MRPERGRTAKASRVSTASSWRTWSTTLLDDGLYRLEVEASDLRGNTGGLHLVFTIVNDL